MKNMAQFKIENKENFSPAEAATGTPCPVSPLFCGALFFKGVIMERTLGVFKTQGGWQVELDGGIYQFTEELYQKFMAMGWTKIEFLPEVA